MASYWIIFFVQSSNFMSVAITVSKADSVLYLSTSETGCSNQISLDSVFISSFCHPLCFYFSPFCQINISAFLNQLWQDNPVLKCLKSAKGLHLNVNSLLKQIQMFQRFNFVKSWVFSRIILTQTTNLAQIYKNNLQVTKCH